MENCLLDSQCREKHLRMTLGIGLFEVNSLTNVDRDRSRFSLQLLRQMFTDRMYEYDATRILTRPPSLSACNRDKKTERKKERIPCLSATSRCGVLSEDSFISLIFSLQLLLVVALGRRPACRVRRDRIFFAPIPIVSY